MHICNYIEVGISHKDFARHSESVVAVPMLCSDTDLRDETSHIDSIIQYHPVAKWAAHPSRD